MVKGGTGSGDVNERDVVNIYQGLLNAGYHVTSKEWIDEYDRAYAEARIRWRDRIWEKLRTSGATGIDFFNIYSTTPFFMPDGPEITETKTDTTIYVLSRVAGEGADRFHEKGDYYLTEKEAKDMETLNTLYEKCVLVINTGGLIDLSFTDKYDNISAIIQLVQPGMEGGNALADVISGKVVPSGKLTDTWANRYEDLEKEYRRLCVFVKTSSLASGESENMKIDFPVYQMSSYDETAAEWIMEEGIYGVWVGNSLADSKLSALLTLDKKKVFTKVKKIYADAILSIIQKTRLSVERLRLP